MMMTGEEETRVQLALQMRLRAQRRDNHVELDNHVWTLDSLYLHVKKRCAREY